MIEFGGVQSWTSN